MAPIRVQGRIQITVLRLIKTCRKNSAGRFDCASTPYRSYRTEDTHEHKLDVECINECKHILIWIWIVCIILYVHIWNEPLVSFDRLLRRHCSVAIVDVSYGKQWLHLSYSKPSNHKGILWKRDYWLLVCLLCFFFPYFLKYANMRRTMNIYTVWSYHICFQTL